MISWDRVKELRDEVGPEDFGEVAELFLEEVEEVLARLRSKPDLTQLEADLHFLKGSDLNLGFKSLCEFCADGEVLAREGAADQIDLSAVHSIFAQSRREFVREGVDFGVAN